MYFSSIDKTLHLPDGVEFTGSYIGGISCIFGKYCPVQPIHELENTDGKTVTIDDAGAIVPMGNNYDPSAFPFLETVPYVKKFEDLNKK